MSEQSSVEIVADAVALGSAVVVVGVVAFATKAVFRPVR